MGDDRPRNRNETCASVVGLLVRAADGELDESDRSRLDGHLARCPSCAEALALQREARAALSAWTPRPASPGFAARVLNQIERSDRQRSWDVRFDAWDFRRWTWRLAPLAAAAAIAATLAVSRVESGAVGVDETMASADVTVAASLASETLSQNDVLALLLTADADEPLAGALEELSQ